MFSGTFTTRHNFASASEMRRGKKKRILEGELEEGDQKDKFPVRR